ncbi:MAG: Trk system potassium uptake protein TrkG [Pelotomaculum sp. PtaB.Bin104]|nr:MAG: Trk system potassium uptake protein TrkG [Pelotomaculum sp. PtaB.Bin104]
MIRAAVILGNLGRILLIVGIAMLICLAWSLAYHESVAISILQAAALTILCGLLLSRLSAQNAPMNFKEGFALVSLGWVLVSVFGTLPYLLSGYVASFADAFFETVSGFTTTGASVISDVEGLPRGLLFWRSLTQWLGGMGIIVLLVAMIARMGARAKQLFKAEVPGPVSENISPRIHDNARKLWITYLVVSALCTISLVACGMDFFDALCNTFTTVATGGFSTKNTGIGFYESPPIEWALTFFMFISGVNFALHFFTFKKRSLLVYWKNAEFKLYAGIVTIVSLLVFLCLYSPSQSSHWGDNLRAAFFQIVSIVTTTGFTTEDYNFWPHLGTALILLMMFVGGCSGSTGGGIKPGRYLIILLRAVIELKKMIHPKAVLPLRYGGRLINDDLLFNVLQFFFLYIIFIAIGMLYLTALGLDIVSSLSATATCLGNIGPGIGLVGPMQNFFFIPDSGKYVLSILMLVGRLEIYPLLVLFLPSFWRE